MKTWFLCTASLLAAGLGAAQTASQSPDGAAVPALPEGAASAAAPGPQAGGEAAAAMAVSPSAEAVAAPARLKVAITLKDGQKAKGQVLGYDAFYLGFLDERGRKVDVPWKEVAEFAPEQATGDTAMIRQYLSNEAQPVTAVIQAKDPNRATAKALWPGILIHGAGYREAGDSDMFLSLAGAEIFGALIAGFGASKVLDAGVTQGDKDTAQYLVWGGGAVFVGSWLVDLAFSRFAAHGFNERHGLSLAPTPQGAAFSMRF